MGSYAGRVVLWFGWFPGCWSLVVATDKAATPGRWSPCFGCFPASGLLSGLGSAFVPILHPGCSPGWRDAVSGQSVMSFRAKRWDLDRSRLEGSSIVPKLHENHPDPCSLGPIDGVPAALRRLGASFVPKQHRRLFRNGRPWAWVVTGVTVVAATPVTPGVRRSPPGVWPHGGGAGGARADNRAGSRPSGARSQGRRRRHEVAGAQATVLDGGSRSATRGHHQLAPDEAASTGSRPEATAAFPADNVIQPGRPDDQPR